MGEIIRYQGSLQHTTSWVRPKSARALLVRSLRKEFGQSAFAAEEIAEESLSWMSTVEWLTLPGSVRLSVPETASRRYAPTRRTTATITAVDVDEDSEVWTQYGLAVLQRRRLLRWIYEIYRQGGHASLTELAAWANLTPTALEHRLEPVRELGIWLPHVGGPKPGNGRTPLEAWLVRRYLEFGDVSLERSVLGVTDGSFRRMMRRLGILVQDPAAEIPAYSAVERDQLATVAQWAMHHPRLRHQMATLIEESLRPLGKSPVDSQAFTPFEGQRYLQWLGETVEDLGLRTLRENEMVFFALSADQGAGARLESARVLPVHLSYFTKADADAGYRGASRRRVFELKFGRIERYANEAWEQGALLSLPDLSLIMGMHTAAIRRKITAHEGRFVPTRGRIWHIGARPVRRDLHPRTAASS